MDTYTEHTKGNVMGWVSRVSNGVLIVTFSQLEVMTVDWFSSVITHFLLYVHPTLQYELLADVITGN